VLTTVSTDLDKIDCYTRDRSLPQHVVVIIAVCNLLSIIVFADVALVTACTVTLGNQCQTLQLIAIYCPLKCLLLILYLQSADYVAVNG
jgi:hypothetical protein